MEAVLSFLSNNMLFQYVVIVLLVIGIIGVFKGNISFSGHGLVIKAQHEERVIIQRQTTFVHGQLDAIANLLVKEHPDLDVYKTYWICKCIELEWIRSIHYNHVENTEGYRNDRFIAIKAIVQKKTQNDYFFGGDFDTFLEDHVKTVVSHLVDIRKYK